MLSRDKRGAFLPFTWYACKTVSSVLTVPCKIYGIVFDPENNKDQDLSEIEFYQTAHKIGANKYKAVSRKNKHLESYCLLFLACCQCTKIACHILSLGFSRTRCNLSQIKESVSQISELISEIERNELQQNEG